MCTYVLGKTTKDCTKYILGITQCTYVLSKTTKVCTNI